MKPTKTPSDDHLAPGQSTIPGQIAHKSPAVIPVPTWLIVGAAIRATCRDSHADTGGPGDYAGILAALDRLATEGNPTARLVAAWIARRRVGVAGPAATDPAVPSRLEADSSSKGQADAVRSVPTRDDEALPPFDRSPVEGEGMRGGFVADIAMTPDRAIEKMRPDPFPTGSPSSPVPHLREPMPDMASGKPVDPAQGETSPDRRHGQGGRAMIKRLGKSKTSVPLPDDLDMELEEMATELLGDKPEKGARPDEPSAVSTPQSASGGRGRPVVAAQRALAGLSPSSDALAARLVRPLWGLREKVNDGGQLLIVLRTRSVDWNAAAEAAAKALLYAAAILREVPFRISSESIDPGARRKTGFETIAEALQADHLIIAVPVGGDLPAPAASLVDLEIDLTAPLTTAEIARTIRRIHRTGSVQRPAPSGCPCPPPEVDLSALNPLEIDVAIKKAATPAAVFTALKKIAALRGDAAGATRPPPNLEDLQGYGDATMWGLNLARDLAAYRAGSLAWADVDAGALLVGPPGTGKTLFASALAKSVGVAFFPTSYSQWQAYKDGHLGSVTQAIRKIFSEAAAAAPALIFIDEIDTLPARGGGGEHDDWWAAASACASNRRPSPLEIGSDRHDRHSVSHGCVAVLCPNCGKSSPAE